MSARTIVVTGAGQGIGKAIALAFARDGARVVLAARTAAKLEAVADEVRAAGGEPVVVPTDVGDAAQVAALASRAGTADSAILAAGIAGPIAPAWEVATADFEATLRANLTGAFLCGRALLPAMVARGSGSVVAIGSMTGKRPLLHRTAYGASKMGLIGLVRALAWDAGPHGVRVNLISPGPVAGSRLDAVADDDARAALLAGAPLGRFATAEDVAATVRFLCSDAAAAITGEDVNVSAGTVTHG
ncbi:MAG: family oxidoreductase [Solirubrobacterales bacterium]|nr:family oxidoreductase [Solirubrobacterales bacterium]